MRLFTLLLVSMSISTVAADWPQFLGPDRTGTVKDSKFSGSLGPLKELWKINVGEGFGGAAISNGEVFMLDRVDDTFDIVRCIDIKSGKDKWQNKYKSEGRTGHNGSRGIPAVGDKYIFTIGIMGDIVCTDRKSGKTVWHKNFAKDWKAKPEGWGFGSSPIIYKDNVIFAPLSSTAGVICANQASGEIVWKTADVGKKNGYASPIITTILGKEQLIQQSSDTVSGINLADGKVLWEYKGYKVSWAIPAPVKVGEDQLFVSGGYGAGSVMIKIKKAGDGYTTEELFRMKKKGSQIHAPIFHNGHLYANFNENDNLKKRGEKMGLICTDLKGNIKWKTAEKPNLNRGSVIMINDSLIALDGDTGELILSKANPDSYKEISRKKVLEGKGKKIWAPMAYVDGMLVIRDQSEMKCLKIY